MVPHEPLHPFFPHVRLAEIIERRDKTRAEMESAQQAISTMPVAAIDAEVIRLLGLPEADFDAEMRRRQANSAPARE